MKRIKLISATAAAFLLIAGSFYPVSSKAPEPGEKCLQGERCWGGTYKYCDNISSGSKCACYNCG